MSLEESSFRQLVTNFADSRRNYSVFMRKDCAFKKYLLGNVIFRQIIANFADFRQNNCVFIGGGVHLKNINSKKSSFFDNKSQFQAKFATP